MKEYIVEEKSTLLDFLLLKLKNKSKNNIKKIIQIGNVMINNEIITKANYELKEKEIVKLNLNYIIDEKFGLKIDIIYEDKSIIVINKPSGISTIKENPTNEKNIYSMVSKYVKIKNKNNKIYIVHRLDKETSGVLLISKGKKLKEMLQQDWNNLVIKRKYYALVSGRVDKSGVVKSYLKEDKFLRVYSTNDKTGKEAITVYNILKQYKDKTLLDIELKTGRKNQIRVHMADIGFPIIGDYKYGVKAKEMFLFAYLLEIINPINNQKMIFQLDLPRNFVIS